VRPAPPGRLPAGRPVLPAVPRGGRPVRGGRHAGPLVADREPAPRPRTPAPEPSGPFRRFVHRYGWRAYAIPVLAVVTVVTLGDLALGDPDDGGGSGAAVPASVSASVEPPVVETPGSIAPGPSDSADVDAGPSSSPATPPAEEYV
jgi:hypothetical protein